MYCAYRVEVNKYGKPRVSGSSFVVIRSDPHQTQSSGNETRHNLSHAPVAVNHVALKQPNRKDERSVGSDGVDSRLKVRELNNIVLQLDVRVVGEVGEPHHADHEDHQVEGG